MRTHVVVVSVDFSSCPTQYIECSIRMVCFGELGTRLGVCGATAVHSLKHANLVCNCVNKLVLAA